MIEKVRDIMTQDDIEIYMSLGRKIKKWNENFWETETDEEKVMVMNLVRDLHFEQNIIVWKYYTLEQFEKMKLAARHLAKKMQSSVG